MPIVFGAAEWLFEIPYPSIWFTACSVIDQFSIFHGATMKFRRFVIAVILGLLPLSPVIADETSHRNSAEEFYSVAVLHDPEKLADAVTGMISRIEPGLHKHQEILREFAREIVTSNKYRDARVRVYQDLLGEEDLRTLTELFRHPVYRKYLALQVQIVQRNAEETFGLFQDELPELVRRINENSEAADPADK